MSYNYVPEALEKVNFFLSKLGYDPDRIDVNICRSENYLRKFDTRTLQIDAFTYSPLPGHFVIYVREYPYRDLLTILAHECVHIDQFMRGDLKLSADNRNVRWKGEIWNNESPYESRPWEQEALSRERKLVKEWKHNLRDS